MNHTATTPHPLDDRLPGMLAEGRALRGIFNGLPSPAVVEMCAFAGFDFVIIDNEHGSADLQTTEHMLRAARASGIVPIVRCFEADIARVLDMGASGVQVPMVETPEQAERLARRVRYPVEGGMGVRGSAFSTRAAGYGAFGGASHTELSNRAIALIVMIESPLGVRNAAQIAAVPGVDVVFVGPNDLSHAMGYGPQWKEPPVQEAIRHVIQTTATAKKCPGTLALTPDDEQRYSDWGARYFANVTTSVITQALQAAARGARPDIRY